MLVFKLLFTFFEELCFNVIVLSVILLSIVMLNVVARMAEKNPQPKLRSLVQIRELRRLASKESKIVAISRFPAG
jgi:hypothetical protein